MGLFEELKRRNVFRVAIGYVITAWLLLQVVDLVLENINAPDWVMQVFMLALAIGFPLAIFFAWAFEMTPEGVKREADVDRSQSITRQTGKKMERNIIIAMALALGYFAYDKFSGPDATDQPEPVTMVNVAEEAPTASLPSQTTNSDEKSVAVLPFINMSDDKENEYFSDGISEELLNVLVKVEGLRVPSRTSSFTFKGSDKKVTEIGQELKVDTVLEGSVRKAGNRIRVTAQLIDVNTDTHLWSETYTRELDDIFAVQDEIAQAIVSALKVTLSGAQETSLSTRSTTSIEAYNKFLLGRHHWNKRSPESLSMASEALKEAVTMDPAFEQAWAALADTYVLMPEYQAGSTKQFIPLAREATEKALAINPQSAHALTTSAYIKFMHDYDFEGARTGFLKAIDLNPNYATAHQWYAELLAVELKPDAAIAELKIARKLDPLSRVIPHVMGWVLAQTDRTEEAYQYYQEALDIDPQYMNTYFNLVGLDLKTGQFDKAREHLHQGLALATGNPATMLAIIDAVENPELSDAALELLLQDNSVQSGTTGRAGSLMALNEYELALDDLEKAIAEGDAYAVHLNRMSVFDPIRDHPRFQALLAKMNLWP